MRMVVNLRSDRRVTWSLDGARSRVRPVGGEARLGRTTHERRLRNDVRRVAREAHPEWTRFARHDRSTFVAPRFVLRAKRARDRGAIGVLAARWARELHAACIALLVDVSREIDV